MEWTGLTLPAVVVRDDPVVTHGLSRRVKYVRLVRRKLGGDARFVVQLIWEGEPYRKLHPDGSLRHRLGQGTVGWDAGPSTLAAVGHDEALLEPLCAELVPRHEVIRVLQRKLDAKAGATVRTRGSHDAEIRDVVRGPRGQESPEKA